MARIRAGSSETAHRGNDAIASGVSNSRMEVYTPAWAHSGKNRFQIQVFNHRNPGMLHLGDNGQQRRLHKVVLNPGREPEKP